MSTPTSPRVLIINGSARNKGRTAALLTQIAALLQSAAIQVDMLDLYAQDLAACLGCETCISHTSVCSQDDSQALLARMASYDGLVLASPVYVGSVTGQLKLLIDKTAWWVHRPQLVGKPGLAVATTAGSNLARVLRYLDYVLVEWGMQPAGRIGRSLRQDQTVEAREVAQFITLLRQDRSSYRPKLREVISFEVKRAFTRLQAIDARHWQQMGWERAPFYYACRLSLPKRLAGWALRVLLGAVIKPRSDVAD